MTVEISGYEYDGLVESTHVSMRRFFWNFSVQRGTPRESDTASRREDACLLNPCDVVAQLVTSQPVTADIPLTLRRFGPKSDHEKKARIIQCAQRT